MHRPIHEIEQDIARVQAALDALPDSAIRQGLDEDYMGQMDALIDEKGAAQAALEAQDDTE